MSPWGVWGREAGAAILTSSAGFTGLVCSARMLQCICRHTVGFLGCPVQVHEMDFDDPCESHPTQVF